MNEVVVSEGMMPPGVAMPLGRGWRCQADSRPRERRGVMDWRIEATITPWKDWEVKSGFMVLMLRDVDAS